MDTERESRERQLKAVGIGEELWDSLFNPKATVALEAAKAFMGSEDTFLVLSGPPGTGKSVAAAWPFYLAGASKRTYLVDEAGDWMHWLVSGLSIAEAKAEARKHWDTKYRDHEGRLRPQMVEVPDEKAGLFVSATRLAAFGLYGPEREEFQRHESAPILALDDLGTEVMRDQWQANLDGLLNARYGRKLQTIITTNLTPEALAKRYGKRIADRLDGRGRVVSTAGASMRQEELRP